MEGMNRVTLIGNVCADPELRQTQAGPVLSIRMATNERWFDKKANQWQDRTEYHSVTVWGKYGEAMAKVLHKGSFLCVDGKLQTTSHEKDGVKRYFTKVVANKVFTGGRETQDHGDDGGEQGPPPQRQQRRQQQQAPAQEPPADDGGGYSGDDDIPF